MVKKIVFPPKIYTIYKNKTNLIDGIDFNVFLLDENVLGKLGHDGGKSGSGAVPFATERRMPSVARALIDSRQTESGRVTAAVNNTIDKFIIRNEIEDTGRRSRDTADHNKLLPGNSHSRVPTTRSATSHCFHHEVVVFLRN